MGARIIMVGLVAALGISMPTGSHFAYWKEAAHDWALNRLAEWDARRSVHESTFVYVADAMLDDDATDVAAAPIPLEAPTAATSAPAPASPASKVEPSPLPEPDLAVGIDLPTQPTDMDESELSASRNITAIEANPRTDEIANSDTTPQAVESAPINDSLAIVTTPVIDDSSFLQAQSETVAAFVADTVIDDSAFLQAQGDTVSAFVADAARLARREEASKSLPVEPVVEVAAVEPIAVDDVLDAGLAFELNRANDGTNLPIATSGDVMMPPANAASTEPIALEADLYGGLAYILNQENDGLNLPPSPSPDSMAPTFDAPRPVENALTHAVRLTREAVFAWAELLHGPAVVTIDR